MASEWLGLIAECEREGYRLLAKDEPVKKGDQVQAKDGSWVAATSWATPYREQSPLRYYRRKNENLPF